MVTDTDFIVIVGFFFFLMLISWVLSFHWAEKYYKLKNRNKTKSIGKFKYKCLCGWSKDDKYGFIPNTECPVHGKKTKKRLEKTVPIK